MAEQKIQFTIGSSYSGEGFTQAKQAVIQLNKTTQQATGVMSNLLREFGDINPKALQASKAITGLMAAFTTLNPVMLAVSAAATALSWGIQQCNKVQEEARQRNERLRESIRNIKDDLDVGFIKKISEEIKQVSAQFESCTKMANELLAATGKLQSSKGAGNVIALQIEKANAMFQALDENGKALAGAYYDEKIASEKLKNIKEEQANKIEQATKSVYDAEQRLNIVRDGLVKLQEEQDALTKQYESNYGDEVAEQEILKKKQNVQNKLIELHLQEEELRQKLNVAIVNEQTAKQDAANAIKLGELAENAAYEASQRLQEAIDKKTEDEEIAAETARQEADAARRLAEQEEEMKDALAERTKLEKELSKKIADENGLDSKISNAEKAVDEATSKYAADQFYTSDLKPGLYSGFNPSLGQSITQAQVEAAIKSAVASGEVKTVKELTQFNKQIEKEKRSEIRKIEGKVAQDKKKYEDLMQKNRKTWSKQDQQFAKGFEKLKEQAEKNLKEIEQRKSDLANLKKQREENHKNIKTISESLKNLTIK